MPPTNSNKLITYKAHHFHTQTNIKKYSGIHTFTDTSINTSYIIRTLKTEK